MAEITLLYTTHRLEMLKFFEKYAEKADVIVLEEPENPAFKQYLKGEIDEDGYLHTVDTEFPKYMKAQLKVLKRLYEKGKEILQVEPYMEKVVEIYRLIERGKLFDALEKDPLLKLVYSVEKQVSRPLVMYYTAVALGDFDKAVFWTVKFAEMDAQRIIIRDELRARKIADLINRGSRILIEAGYIHTPLREMLKKLSGNVKIVSALEEAARELGLAYRPHPGDELTWAFMEDRGLTCRELRLLGARALAYITLINKEELEPAPDNPYPHLLDQHKATEAVSKMTYEECKERFLNYTKNIRSLR
jgi:hypothetical protein